MAAVRAQRARGARARTDPARRGRRPDRRAPRLARVRPGRPDRVCERSRARPLRPRLGLLEVLLQRIGRLVSKEQLVDHLCEWGEEVSNNAIEVYVHRLRKKIEPSGVRISTVRGLGYCLERSRPPRRRHGSAPARGGRHAVALNPGVAAMATPAHPAIRPARRRRPPTRRATRATRTRSRRPTKPMRPRRPRSLFGEILDWMLAPLLLLGR